MAEKEVFMDTNIFTGIVDDIRGAASACILKTEPLSKLRNSMIAVDDTLSKSLVVESAGGNKRKV